MVLDSVLGALQQLFPKKRIVVADSSVIGCDTRSAAKVGGIIEVCHRRHISFVDLRYAPFEPVHLDGALEFPALPISAPFLSPNVFKINVAKLKSTYGSPASFAIKNSKGCIPDEFKLRFHLRGLQRSLCDLGRAIGWDFVISEALPASELGRPKASGVVTASTNAVACDLAACLALSIPFDNAFHVEWLAKYYDLDLGWAAGDPAWDSFVEACPKLTFSRTTLQDLEAAYGIRINDGRPCSSCLESLAKAMIRTAEHQSTRDAEAIVGADISGSSIGGGPDKISVFIGNCAFDRCAMELDARCYPDSLVTIWKEAVKVPGCPPTIDSMATALRVGLPGQTFDDRTSSRRIEDAMRVMGLSATATASYMSELAVMVPPEQISFDNLGREERLAAEVICSAICHQMNWDVLRSRLRDAFTDGFDWWRPGNLQSVSAREIDTLLHGYSKPERIRAKQRAEMIRSIADLFDRGARSYSELFPSAILSDSERQALKEVLERCAVFAEDPARKKMQVLLHRLAVSGLVAGIESLCDPAIDYHIMRLYARRGEVAPVSATGADFIERHTPRRAVTVTAFRRTVAQALSLVASLSGQPIPVVNGVEWWIGRSVCTRSNPDCELKREESKWLRPHYERCPFAGHCLALNVHPVLLEITEPLYAGRTY